MQDLTKQQFKGKFWEPTAKKHPTVQAESQPNSAKSQSKQTDQFDGSTLAAKEEQEEEEEEEQEEQEQEDWWEPVWKGGGPDAPPPPPPLIHPLTLSNLSKECLWIMVTTIDIIATKRGRSYVSEQETVRLQPTLVGQVFVGQMSPRPEEIQPFCG